MRRIRFQQKKSFFSGEGERRSSLDVRGSDRQPQRSSSASRASACQPRLRPSQSTIVFQRLWLVALLALASRVPAEPRSASLSLSSPVPAVCLQQTCSLSLHATLKEVLAAACSATV